MRNTTVDQEILSQIKRIVNSREAAEILKNKEGHMNKFAIHKPSKSKRFDKESIEKAFTGHDDFRPIHSPSADWKNLQKRLLEWLSHLNRTSSKSIGFELGKNVSMTARAHRNSSNFILTDIKGCFQNLNIRRLEKWAKTNLDLTNREAMLFAGLTTYEGYTCQGLPTSPILINLVMLDMDKRLLGVARKHNLVYTRYADDITISGSEKFSAKTKKLIFWIIADEGWKIASKKTHVTSQRYINLNGCLLDTETGVIRIKKGTRRKIRWVEHIQTKIVNDELIFKLEAVKQGCLAFDLMVRKNNSNPLRNEMGLRIFKRYGVWATYWLKGWTTDENIQPFNRNHIELMKRFINLEFGNSDIEKGLKRTHRRYKKALSKCIYLHHNQLA